MKVSNWKIITKDGKVHIAEGPDIVQALLSLKTLDISKVYSLNGSYKKQNRVKTITCSNCSREDYVSRAKRLCRPCWEYLKCH